MAHIIKLPLLP